MKSILSIWRYITPRTNLAVLFFIFNLLSVLFGLLSLSMLVPFLNLLFGQAELVTQHPGWSYDAATLVKVFQFYLSNVIIQYGKVQGLVFICCLLAVAIFLKNAFLYLSRYVMSPLRNAIIRDIRRDMFHKMVGLPVGFFTEERKGDMITRMTSDVSEIEISVISTLDLLFKEPITILIYLVLMFAISPQLSIFLILFLPITGGIIGRISKSLRKQSADTQSRLGGMVSILEETLGGLRILKAFTAERQQEERFNKENGHIFHLNNSINYKRDLASPLSEFLGVLILCMVLWYGGRLVLSTPPEINAGQFIMFILFFTQLLTPLKSFSTIFYNIHKGNASLDRIRKILDAENPITEVPNAKKLETFGAAIEFRNVTFGYNGNTVLENINLTIPKGKMVALVGASGAGKSTFVDLIPRFHDVISGEILIDGINIKEYTLHSLRQQMGMVSQEPILFNDTIENNITLGTTGTSQEQVIEAAKIANAHNFICQKEEGYHTTVGDRGSKLSGGERQRVTIARAVLKNPPILILDEATSSLDTESERIVQDAINNLMQNRTSIVIAHRLSTVQHADEIIVLQKGRIAERGTHAELLQQGGVYHKLVAMQQVK